MPRPTRLFFLPGLALALLGLVAFEAGAANPLVTATKAPAEPAKPAVEAIAPGDIPSRANVDERFVQEILQHAQQRDPSTKLEPQLGAIAEGIVHLSQTFRKDDLRDMSAIRLESLESHWRFYDRELADWRRELQRLSAPYTDDAAELAKRRAVWEATRSAMEATGGASALTDRVQGMLAQITLAEQALSGPLENQISLGRRANTVQASIDSGRKAVDAAIAYYDRRLSMIDAAPLWKAWNDIQFSQAELAGTAAGLQVENAFLTEWSAANQARIRAYKVGALLLLPALLWLSRRSRKIVATDPDMRESAKVLTRPLSAWLVLVLVGQPFFFPDAPLILHQVALLFALIPVLRLLPREVFKIMRSWPYITTALYVLYRLGFLLLGQPLYFRLHLVAIAVLTGATIAWLLVTAGRETAPGTIQARVHGVVRALGWTAVAALLVAITANVVGNVTLAEMLCGAVLDSAYLGLALYAGANVLVSILRLLLARKTVTRFRVITQHTGPLLESLTRLLMLAALVTWIVIALNELRIARPVFGWLKRVLTYPIGIGELSLTAGNILLFAISVWIAFWVARTVRILLQDEVLPKMQLPRGVGNSVSTLTYYALIMVGLFVALAAAGFHLSQVAIVVGALSVGIGFGLQNVVNNFVSGLILMFERPIQPGDVVEVSGTSGTVRDIGMRATTLTTFEGADVVVPNGTLLSEKLINWTLSDMSRRIDVNVGVAYGSDPRKVLALLLEVAKGTPGVASIPEPSAVFVGLGASSLDFAIRAWTNNFNEWVNIRTEMTVRVYEALAAAGIQIPFPQQELHLRSISPQARADIAATLKPGSETAG